MPADRLLDWKRIKNLLNVRDVRFATEQEAENLTGVGMGSVPPFGSLLGLETFFDESIKTNEYVNFNPGSKTHTIRLKTVDLINLETPKLAGFVK
ncbi:MAG: YbaK/EbsC family protein [Candidatus Blackburnbacteria bacterium]|nr:YbaK/EbsC family protein [Candidatus Blackburnbacteria bacterium]